MCYYINTNCLSAFDQGAFNWKRPDSDLSRLTFGPPNPDLLKAWRYTCAETTVEDIVVLGPDDQTPDVTKHVDLASLQVLSAHEADTADMEALRGILHEPDEVFTLRWDDYGAGHREFCAIPILDADSCARRAFWTAYWDALKQYTGPVMGRSREEFDTFVKRAWRYALGSSNLGSGYFDGQNMHFALWNFPFCSLSFNLITGVWTSEGWLPDDLEQIDPGRRIRKILEKEIAMEFSGD